MKKLCLSINEVLKYQREAIISIPDDMTDDELNNILDEVQRNADFAADIADLIECKRTNISIVKRPDIDLSNPWDTEVEIQDVGRVKTNV